MRAHKCPQSPELTSLSHRVGAPKNWPFDHWITPTRKIVVVSIYYRLSVIGFLSHPRLVESGLGDLNVGIQDQIQALRWIQANVSSFGGDPSKMSVVQRGNSNPDLFFTSRYVDRVPGRRAFNSSSWRMEGPTRISSVRPSRRAFTGPPSSDRSRN